MLALVLFVVGDLNHSEEPKLLPKGNRKIIIQKLPLLTYRWLIDNRANYALLLMPLVVSI